MAEELLLKEEIKEVELTADEVIKVRAVKDIVTLRVAKYKELKEAIDDRSRVIQEYSDKINRLENEIRKLDDDTLTKGL